MSKHTMLTEDLSTMSSSLVTDLDDANVTNGIGTPKGSGPITSVHVVYVIALSISIMGLIGNIFTILVLKLHKPKSVYIFFLQVLAVADGLVMFFTIALVTMGLLKCRSCGMVIKVCVSCHDIAQFLSHWILVSASLDRFLAFNDPFKKGCMKGCSQKKGWVITLAILTAAVLFEIPRMVEVPKDHHLFTTSINMAVRYIAPLVILMYVNVRLVFYVRQVQQDHEKLTRKDNEQSRTRSATIMLIMVVFIFLICGITRTGYLILNVAKLKSATKTYSLTSWILIMFNNAFNFVIYVMFYKKFRQNLRKLWICRMCFKKSRGHIIKSTATNHSKYHTVQSTVSLTNTQSSL